MYSICFCLLITFTGSDLVLIQEINLNKSLSNDLAFHSFQDGNIILALGLDTGALALYDLNKDPTSAGGDSYSTMKFVPILTLQKHEDWIRCIDFVTLGKLKLNKLFTIKKELQF